jgi:hypothetical protein
VIRQRAVPDVAFSQRVCDVIAMSHALGVRFLLNTLCRD